MKLLMKGVIQFKTLISSMIQDLERDSLFDSKESRSGSGSIPATLSDFGSIVVDNLEKRLSILQ